MNIYTRIRHNSSGNQEVWIKLFRKGVLSTNNCVLLLLSLQLLVLTVVTIVLIPIYTIRYKPLLLNSCLKCKVLPWALSDGPARSYACKVLIPIETLCSKIKSIKVRGGIENVRQ